MTKKGEKATEQFLIEILDRGILDMREFGSLVNILAEEDGGTNDGRCGCLIKCGCDGKCLSNDMEIYRPEDPNWAYSSNELRNTIRKIIGEFSKE